jgi:hypothetical protein
VASAVDRVQRSFKESVILDEMRNKGIVQIHFLRENVIIDENSSSTDEMIWDMSVMGAKMFIGSLRDKIKSSNQKKLENGEYTRKAPVGYTNYRDEQGRSQITLDETRAYLVKKAFELYATGTYSIQKITKYLEEQGFTNNYKPYKMMANSGVHKMLQNKFYIGIMTVKGVEYPHKYEKIVDEWLFNRCQEVMHGKNQKTKKRDNQERIRSARYFKKQKHGSFNVSLNRKR